VLAAHTESELAALSEDIRSQIANLRSRARRLVDALRKSREQQQDLESRVRASLEAQREAESRLHELAALPRDAERRAKEYEATIESLRHQVEDLTEELEAQRQQHQQLTEQLEQAQSREAELRVGAQADGVTQLEPCVGSDDNWLNDDLPASAGAENDPLSTIARLPSRSLWSHTTPRAETTSSPSGQTSPGSSRAPVSFIEQYAPHLLDAEPDEQEADIVREARQAKPDRAAAADLSAHHDSSERRASATLPKQKSAAGNGPNVAAPQGDDDESLEEYMAKLMQRVRGPDSQTAWTAPKTEETRSAPTQTIPKVVTERVGSPEYPTLPAFRLEDLKRGMPPERVGGFAAMRELANQSAQGAISSYRTQRGTRNALARLLASGVCLASGIGVILLEPELLSVAGAGGAAAIAASAYFALRGVGALFILNR
jgi:hypothetical protein